MLVVISLEKSSELLRGVVKWLQSDGDVGEEEPPASQDLDFYCLAAIKEHGWDAASLEIVSELLSITNVMPKRLRIFMYGRRVELIHVFVLECDWWSKVGSVELPPVMLETKVVHLPYLRAIPGPPNRGEWLKRQSDQQEAR